MRKDENILFFNKLSFKEKFSYGLGDLASNLVFAALSSFIVIFWTDVVQITAATAGLIILVSKIWDGINDPIMGFIIDRTKSTHGKARPWLIWSSIPFAISAVLVFCAPNLSPQMRVVYAFITYILVTSLYTMINIPYGVLAAKMTTDQNERGSLNVFRMALAMTGMIIVSSFLIPISKILGHGNLKKGIPLTMLVFSTVSVVLFYIVFRNTKEIVGNSSLENKEDVKFLVGIKSLFHNRAWIIEFFSGVLAWIGNGGRMAVTAYYAIYVLNNGTVIPLLMMVPLFAQIFGMVILSMPLAKRFGKVKTSIYCSLISGTLSILLFLITDRLTIVLLVLAISSFVNGPNMSFGFARLADTIEYGEYKTGVRVEGLTYAGGSMGGKLGSGLAGVVVGLVLSATGYIPDHAQTDLAINGIKALMFLIPGVSIIVMGILLMFSDLDKVYPDAIRNLARRRVEEYGEN